MRRHFAKFLSLTPADRRMLMRAAIALAKARLALRLMPFPAARKVIVRGQRRTPVSVPPPSAERIVWVVATAGRAIPGARNCLVQALVAQAMLLHAGHRCGLRIGVAKEGPRELRAHAWLESADGKVLIGDFELDRYHPLVASGRPASDAT